MADSDTPIVVLIDPVSDPISGTVRHGASESTDFVGYARLVAEIERHRALSADVAGRAARGDNCGVEHDGGGG